MKTYTKLVCSLLDIPVHDNPVESLHVLFTLYLEFKNNPIFKQHMDMESRWVGGGVCMRNVAGAMDAVAFCSETHTNLKPHYNASMRNLQSLVHEFEGTNNIRSMLSIYMTLTSNVLVPSCAAGCRAALALQVALVRTTGGPHLQAAWE